MSIPLIRTKLHSPPAPKDHLGRGRLLERLERSRRRPLTLVSIQRLEQANMFVTPLDDQRRWWRHHHLFQQLLLRQLERRRGPDEIAGLHRRAGEWYSRHELLDEALWHYLAAKDIPAAERLATRARHALTAREQWPSLERWIKIRRSATGKPTNCWIDCTHSNNHPVSLYTDMCSISSNNSRFKSNPGEQRRRQYPQASRSGKR